MPIVIKEELTPADLAFVDSHRDFFPELVLIQAQRRLYPQNGMLAHVIGYTGEISEDELDSPEFAKYDPGDVIGKFGIEREYNDWLMGVDGQRQVVVDNRGQVRAGPENQAGRSRARTCNLTIDLDLQAVAELAMDRRQGTGCRSQERRGGGARSAHRAKCWPWSAGPPSTPTSSPCASSRKTGRRSPTTRTIRC